MFCNLFMVKKCCYPNCRSGYAVFSKGVNKSRAVLSMHKFPDRVKDPLRFKIWQKFTGRHDLHDLKELNLCSLHFDKKYKKWTNKITDRPRLTADAIPTVSDVCRSLTVITPEKENGGYCFKDHFPKVRKNNLNDIFSVTDPDFPDLVNDFVGIQKQKIKSNGDLISFLDCFIKDSK